MSINKVTQLPAKVERRSFLEILLLGTASISILWSIYFAVVTISIPYPIEYREGAAQVMTDFLLHSQNPFTFENQPRAMNNYGLGYNLAVLPFAALFGNTLLVHRSVTLGFILLCSLIGFFLVYKTRGDIAYGAMCAAFIMIGLINIGGIGAFPSAMGVFLFMMAIFVPYVGKFNRLSLLLSILVSLLAFYSKAYFVLGFGIVASYLFLFVSKKTGLLYVLGFMLLFTISFCVMRVIFPLYFVNIILSNISNTGRSAAHLLAQLKDLLFYFYPILLSLPFVLWSQRGAFRNTTGELFSIRKWDKPLMNHPFDLVLYSLICSFLTFILLLGPHVGNYLSYAYQLVFPMFFCWFFMQFDSRTKLGFLLLGLVAFNLFLWQRSVLSPELLAQKNSKGWSDLYAYIDGSLRILDSPVITPAMLAAGQKAIDSGQTSYFYILKPYRGTILGPSYDTWDSDGFEYVRFIDNSIKNQKFDLIFTVLEKNTFYHLKLVEQYYVLVDEIRVEMPQADQMWTILVWKPMVE